MCLCLILDSLFLVSSSQLFFQFLWWSTLDIKKKCIDFQVFGLVSFGNCMHVQLFKIKHRTFPSFQKIPSCHAPSWSVSTPIIPEATTEIFHHRFVLLVLKCTLPEIFHAYASISMQNYPEVSNFLSLKPYLVFLYLIYFGNCFRSVIILANTHGPYHIPLI